MSFFKILIYKEIFGFDKFKVYCVKLTLIIFYKENL
jgi:hypothetical protein